MNDATNDTNTEKRIRVFEADVLALEGAVDSMRADITRLTRENEIVANALTNLINGTIPIQVIEGMMPKRRRK